MYPIPFLISFFLFATQDSSQLHLEGLVLHFSRVRRSHNQSIPREIFTQLVIAIVVQYLVVACFVVAPQCVRVHHEFLNHVISYHVPVAAVDDGLDKIVQVNETSTVLLMTHYVLQYDIAYVGIPIFMFLSANKAIDPV